MQSQYQAKPDGLAGNDDLGQMSAWYMFTALGFYPVAPGSNEYILGRPFLDKAELHLPNGKTFTIRAEHLSDAHPYVGSVRLNGVLLDKNFLRHEQIMAGGELVFSMQAQANKQWGQSKAARPYSQTAYQ